MQDILVRNLLKITGSCTDLSLLGPVLVGFANGQVIQQVGRGASSKVTCGQISRIYLNNSPKLEITIECSHLYERNRATLRPNEDWIAINDPDKPIVFPFTWFRLPHKVSERHPVPKLKLENIKTDSRLWLCPESDPGHLNLFRLSLLRMFSVEAFENRTIQKLMRRLRVRLLKPQ